jgi:hypothetical protein
MGFLQRLLRNVFRDGKTTVGASSFDRLSEEELETHLSIVRYGDFVLTDAIRPSYDVQVKPQQGFRHDVYRDDASQSNVPVLLGAASATRLFELFLDLLDPLGTEADVVLETSHNRESRGHTDSSSDYFAQRFEELKTRLGIDSFDESGFDTGNNWGAYA